MIVQSKISLLTASTLDEQSHRVLAKYLPAGTKMIILSSATRPVRGRNHTWYIVLLFSKTDLPMVIWGDDEDRTFDELFSII